MEPYLSNLSYFEIRRFQAESKKLLQLTEDFLTSIDHMHLEALLKRPNHNIVDAIRLRDGLNIVLSILNDELEMRRKPAN